VSLRPAPDAIADILIRRLGFVTIDDVPPAYLARFLVEQRGTIVAAVASSGIVEAIAGLPDPPAPVEPIRAQHVMCANCTHIRHVDEPEDHIAMMSIPCPGAGGIESKGPRWWRWLVPDESAWSAFRAKAMVRKVRCPVCLGMAQVFKGRIWRHVRVRYPRDGRGRKPVECEGIGVGVAS
jgi:hypothetical protein